MAYPVIRSKHRVTRGFTKLHRAVDIAPLIKGTPEPVYAVGKGRITHVGIGSWMSGKNFILTLDGDGSMWWYTHLSTIGSIRHGQTFEDGEQLAGAMTGNTGNSFGVHLHLVRFAGKLDHFTDPWPYIKDEPDPGAKPAPAKVNAPAPSLYGRIRAGAPVLLASAWRRYKYSNLSGSMAPSTLKAGRYRIVKTDRGSALLTSDMPGYVAQGWVNGYELERRGGVVG